MCETKIEAEPGRSRVSVIRCQKRISVRATRKNGSKAIKVYMFSASGLGDYASRQSVERGFGS